MFSLWSWRIQESKTFTCFLWEVEESKNPRIQTYFPAEAEGSKNPRIRHSKHLLRNSTLSLSRIEKFKNPSLFSGMDIWRNEQFKNPSRFLLERASKELKKFKNPSLSSGEGIRRIEKSKNPSRFSEQGIRRIEKFKNPSQAKNFKNPSRFLDGEGIQKLKNSRIRACLLERGVQKTKNSGEWRFETYLVMSHKRAPVAFHQPTETKHYASKEK